MTRFQTVACRRPGGAHGGVAERGSLEHAERSPVAVEQCILLGADLWIEPALDDDPAQQAGIEPSRARVFVRRGDRGVDLGAVVLQPLDLSDVTGARDIVDRPGEVGRRRLGANSGRGNGNGEAADADAVIAPAGGVVQLGDLERALALIDKAIEQIERPGWEERQYYAEALRVKGWLLSLKGDSQGAEGAYIASLDWARTQQAKSWELRTATSYVRLMRDQGRVGDGRDLLAPVYGWFTEGFGTKDLKEAKQLLDELT
jgi:hypothetical protein